MCTYAQGPKIFDKISIIAKSRQEHTLQNTQYMVSISVQAIHDVEFSTKGKNWMDSTHGQVFKVSEKVRFSCFKIENGAKFSGNEENVTLEEINLLTTTNRILRDSEHN